MRADLAVDAGRAVSASVAAGIAVCAMRDPSGLVTLSGCGLGLAAPEGPSAIGRSNARVRLPKGKEEAPLAFGPRRFSTD